MKSIEFAKRDVEAEKDKRYGIIVHIQEAYPPVPPTPMPSSCPLCTLCTLVL